VSKPEMPKQMLVQVTGQPPLEAGPALFGNFLGISRVGGNIQFEFIYLDLNTLALMMQNTVASNPTATVVPALTGMTVSKIVMPAEAFVQTEEHFKKMFAEVRAELNKAGFLKNEQGEQHNERQRASS
jgi:hypothetical protein